MKDELILFDRLDNHNYRFGFRKIYIYIYQTLFLKREFSVKICATVKLRNIEKKCEQSWKV